MISDHFKGCHLCSGTVVCNICTTAITHIYHGNGIYMYECTHRVITYAHTQTTHENVILTLTRFHTPTPSYTHCDVRPSDDNLTVFAEEVGVVTEMVGRQKHPTLARNVTIPVRTGVVCTHRHTHTHTHIDTHART